MSDTPPTPWRWSDANRAARSPFEKSRAVEARYAMTLRRVAAQVQAIVDGFPDPIEDHVALAQVQEALNRYSDLLDPWARAVGTRMIGEANRQDEQAWNRVSRDMSRGLRAELASADVGLTMRESLARQVVLIKSLPTDAAERVHKLTLEGILQGTRAAEIAREIGRSGQVTASRATLIARTEVSRTSTELTKARALSVESEGYTWETSRDSDVRPSHAKMQGRFVEWANPPTLDNLTGHAGCLPNCRCWTRVVIPGLGHNSRAAFAEG